MYIKCVLNQKSFIITVLPNKENPLKSGFQCTCNSIKSEIELHPSTAVNACYKEVFNTKTEYSGLAIIGFKNENIIQQLTFDIELFPIFLHIEKLNVIVSSIGNLNEGKFYGIGAGFVSSFTAHYQNAQHLFVLIIEEEIYLESVCKNKSKGKTPDEVWNKVEIYKKYTRTYLCGITNELVQKHIEAIRSESPVCTADDWMNRERLEKIFNRHIKSRKISNVVAHWPLLFCNWHKQKSSVIQFPDILHEIYPSDYSFQDKELRAWRAMFVACG
ncbi:hypothetical protein C2G38_2036057 [Gigaspora rosea]|uniref:Uncharacterized protein n=1 Tax=Gigaspora rosea TaxID=44941 RepID=A0A397VCI1_9GLOM|nr:hypothetical protein C2G38_2036057 [Gigaspora rosea]